MQYEYVKLYYNNYTQVRYFDPEYNRFMGGIAYKDFIIRGADGSILNISDLESSEDYKPELSIVELSWADLDEKILKG